MQQKNNSPSENFSFLSSQFFTINIYKRKMN